MTSKDHASTFAKQPQLPRLPVPTLQDTCTRVLEWITPLVNKEEIQNTANKLEQFLEKGGDGEKLQERLLCWANNPEIPNWLQPFWYDMYLFSRSPLPINSNFFYLCDEIPAYNSYTQTQKAAALITALLDFKKLIDQEIIPIDEERGKPMCMEQYKYLFTTTRIPGQLGDCIHAEARAPHSKEKAGHVVVFYRDRVFNVDVFSQEQKAKSPQALEVELRAIMEMVQKEAKCPASLGVLTTLPRTQWAKARQQLLQNSPHNQEAITSIEDALFAVVLEDAAPQSILDTSRFFMHSDGTNRWYDKSFQLIVCANGKAGLNVEHSGIDGSPTRSMLGHITQGKITPDWSQATSTSNEPQELHFVITPKTKEYITHAKQKFTQFIEDTHIRVLEFTNFGKNGIKAMQVSPDAFIQIALQLAQYKAFKSISSTYEAVMTRQFLHGRTEAMRPVTMESVEFIQYFEENANPEIALPLFKKAAKKHIDKIGVCKKGTGVERHFLGLRKMYELFGKEIGVHALPAIFEDAGWKRLTHSILATSTSDPRGMFLAGYGPVVDDGYGVRYVIKNDRINFNISSRSAQKNDLERFADNLHQSLEQIAILAGAPTA